MWNSKSSSANYYGHPPPRPGGTGLLSAGPPPSSGGNTAGQKHDIFVGNLAFSTTEEQLYAAFSELGRIVKIRMVSDLDTGKPRGFAFIEFGDPQAALSAIRNMNEYEINGRKIRVNFSNSSHLETLANQLGMDLSHITGKKERESQEAKASGGNHGPGGRGDGTSGPGGGKAVASLLKALNKAEMYDVVAKLKEIADANPDEARKLLTQHPQMPEAILYCMSELDMIKTPVTTPGALPAAPPAALPPPPVTAPAAPATKPSDPRARNAPAPPPPAAPVAALPPPPAMALPADPRARPVDPRAGRDPRTAAPGGGGVQPGAPHFPPPPMMPPPAALPPPPMAPPAAVPGLDPSLVQQVMALTPAQIAQLPPDKQQSILALRQQITSGVRH